LTTETMPLAPRLAALYGAAIWAAAAVAVAVVGDRIFPRPGAAAVAPVILGLSLLAALAAGAATVDYMRRTGLSGAGAGLAFGATIAAVGLVLDGTLMLVAGLQWPNLDADRTRTVAAFLLLGYAALVLAPWWVGARMRR
jgi:hypothetical protein